MNVAFYVTLFWALLGTILNLTGTFSVSWWLIWTPFGVVAVIALISLIFVLGVFKAAGVDGLIDLWKDSIRK